MRINSKRLIPIIALALACSHMASAATVNYSGKLTELFGGPLDDDLVIIGTFQPGFDVNQYFFTFGSGAGGNWTPDHYANATSSGIFRPIGSGTTANAQGVFSGSGTTTGIDNLPIWIFMFENQSPQSSIVMALFSSTDPSWRVQNNGIANIDTSTSNMFKVGSLAGNGAIQMTFAPIPEPGAAFSLMIAGGLTFSRRVRRV